MTKRSLYFCWLNWLFGLLAFLPSVLAQEIVTLTTRPGVTQAYFLASVPKRAQAIALLFPGAGGFLHLRKEGDQIKFGNDNFLVRSRREFLSRGAIVAILEAPSDQQRNWGMTDEFRLSEQHFADVSAVVNDLAARFPNLPLFLVGTSRGSVSVASLGARFGNNVAGAILTASMFRPSGRQSKEPGPGLSKFDFATIKAPVLVVHHVSDPCAITPYSDAARLADTYPLITVWGGLPARSGECDAFSAHGFYGKEAPTIEQIVNWMVKKPFQSEVK
jgi:predicted alpha/beta hydrolase family esterase